MKAFALTLAPIFLVAACTSTRVPLVDVTERPSVDLQQDSDTGTTIYRRTAGQSQPKKARTSVHLLFGQRWFSDSGLEPLDEPLMAGVDMSWQNADWLIGFETGLNGSRNRDSIPIGSSDLTVTHETVEFYGGGRFERNFGDTPLRYYLGAGPSLVYARMKKEYMGEVGRPDYWTVGVYGHAGLLYDLDPFEIGVDVRTLQLTGLMLSDEKANADYFQVALVLGYHF